MQFPYSEHFIKTLHYLYTKTDVTTDQIGERLGLKERQIYNILRRLRGLDPDKWPKRYQRRNQ